MKYLFVSIIALLYCSCIKKADISEVFQGITINDKSLPADGSSTTTVTVELPVEADPSKRGVIFSASNGSFVGAQQGKLVVKADFAGGKLIAKATYKTSLKAGDATISIVSELSSPYGDFTLTDKITLTPSLSSMLKLEYSAPGISNNYKAELFLRAQVMNGQGKGVSSGVEVRFQEFTVPASGFAGRFRYSNQGTTTADSSSVSTFFSVGNIPPNTDFFLKAEVFENGVPSGKSDIIHLTVIN